ncbi:hypothetical protein ABVK25_000821 [Lepraria finkii]|uniref:Dol-P-Glc:Glc(2)Man(9)GlcNAc(2)-PP-Dol alpha-1,2-glucosyltransferase n=1 Tax=Lepraria finkii TaxID=1340010 RepID=A0ABR4BSG7_9LECA
MTPNEAALRPFAYALVILLAAHWFSLVQETVPEPYLDEVFHVRQAKNYVQGKWNIWDPKITTPPGLYLWSYLIALPQQAFEFGPIQTTFFRVTNLGGALLLPWVLRNILFSLAKIDDKNESSNANSVVSWSTAELVHAAVNICLFPPLFFFYGLYYTDVLSAFTVLVAYRCYLENEHKLWIFLSGVISLLFRQTNSLWVSVFLGGLAFCRSIRKGRPDVEFSNQSTFRETLQASWNHALAYDPPISEARFEDYINSGLSFAVAGAADLSTALWPLTPYLILLYSFALFVYLNGGIVLGDKENHVVSIHLAQMLYVWPSFVFFSLPLLYPYIVNIAIPSTLLPEASRISSACSRWPRAFVAIPILAVMIAIAHYNTLVHPFTLADNRHYTFYVFRILLRHSAVKYLAVPIYFLCAWAAIAALGGQQVKKAPSQASPQHSASSKKTTRNTDTNKVQSPPLPPSGSRASFVLVWLLATTVSLVSTPLVEPRYFIVPWLMWRLNIAPIRLNNTISAGSTPSISNDSDWQGIETVQGILYKWHDHRLWLETVWFLLINAVTGYIFLNWGFEWPQEPGKVQRFMW